MPKPLGRHGPQGDDNHTPVRECALQQREQRLAENPGFEGGAGNCAAPADSDASGDDDRKQQEEGGKGDDDAKEGGRRRR